jgi:hypothetical protein
MKRSFWICLWILSLAVLGSAQTSFYFPHVANGVVGASQWRTTILLTNPGSAPASGTVTFTQDNADLSLAGAPFAGIAFVDQAGAPAGSGGVITFSIAAGETRKYTSTGAGAYAGGFATVVTTAGTVTGTAIFSDYRSGRLFAEAGVPAATAVPNQAIFVDTQGFNVGYAYSNVGNASAPVTLSLLNSSAAPVATTTQTLGPGNHNARFINQLTDPNFGSFVGTGRLEIRSAAPLAAIALRFDTQSGVFTTLPPVTLAAALISPAVQWLEQRPWLAPLTSIAKLLGALQFNIG